MKFLHTSEKERATFKTRLYERGMFKTHYFCKLVVHIMAEITVSTYFRSQSSRGKGLGRKRRWLLYLHNIFNPWPQGDELSVSATLKVFHWFKSLVLARKCCKCTIKHVHATSANRETSARVHAGFPVQQVDTGKAGWSCPASLSGRLKGEWGEAEWGGEAPGFWHFGQNLTPIPGLMGTNLGCLDLCQRFHQHTSGQPHRGRKS